MHVCSTITECHSVRDQLQGSVALVPTMGNLHEGHLTLIREAKLLADNVIVTIFINPMQFGANEDLDSYPRTLKQDLEKLTSLDVDLVFTPSNAMIYPQGQENHTRILVPNLTNQYCGSNRPGHYTGVATIVLKLFNLTSPDIALFGKKDFQQLVVIKKMAIDLGLRIEIKGIDTVRENSGLAMSSRNQYLTEQERDIAQELSKILSWAKSEVVAGNRLYHDLGVSAIDKLNAKGFEMEYFAISDQSKLQPADETTTQIVILAAGKLGATRLIDNLDFEL